MEPKTQKPTKNATKVAPMTEHEKTLSATIMLAVEMDSAFKLYSYRIIDHDTFISRVAGLIAIHEKNKK